MEEQFIETEKSISVASIFRYASFFVCLFVAAIPSIRCFGADETAEEIANQAAEVLKEHCWECHAGAVPSSGLSLDNRDAILRGGDSGKIVNLDQPLESELIRRLVTDDLHERMPPEKEPLSRENIELLSRWLKHGFPWPKGVKVDVRSSDHWSLKPITRPAIPRTSVGTGPVNNPVDSFIAAKLESLNLTLSPPSNARTLLRRVYLDLTGLLPTFDEVKQFEDDPSEANWNRIVARLLASPRFGERYAPYWLDTVRFAETSGYEVNTPRPNAWPYRDYVIKAISEDKPYDQFVMEQIAGDQFSTDEAMGFLTGGSNDLVKSPDPVLTANQRADELHDMVSTTGSTFLGLTVGCARCHSHKFDPIPQTDYYSVKAIFEGVQHGDRTVSRQLNNEEKKRFDALRETQRQLETELTASEPIAIAADAKWIGPNDPVVEVMTGTVASSPYQSGTSPGLREHTGSETTFPTIGRGYRYQAGVPNQDLFAISPKISGKYRVFVSWGAGWHTHSPEVHYLVDEDGDLQTQDDRKLIGKADHRRTVSQQTSTDDRFPEQSTWSDMLELQLSDWNETSRLVVRCGDKPGYVSLDLVCFQQVTSGDEVATSKRPFVRLPSSTTYNVERFSPVVAKQLRFTILATNASEPCIDELEVYSFESPSANVALASKGTVAKSSSDYPDNTKHKLEHINDGRYGNDYSWISNEPGRGWIVYEFPEPVEIDRVMWSRDRGDVPQFFDRTATRYLVEVSTDGVNWRTVATSGDRLPPGTVVPGGFISADAKLQERVQPIQQQLASTRAELERLSMRRAFYCGVLATPTTTYRLHRGDPMQPREAAAPGALSAIPIDLGFAAAQTEPARRLNFARWLVDRRNPLPARVIVNRIWQWHFGEGLVATPSDFGSGGTRPTHPELLDWLASELIEHDWSLHHIHRLILASRTYQQSSQSTEKGRMVDSQARFLWRFPARRLDAEALRDCVLQVSGMLDLRSGGPGWSPFVPNDNYVRVYNAKTEFLPDDFRRMVYMTRSRMHVEPTFGTFDCPDGGQTAPKRNRSITPLQSLSLLNSPFMLLQSTRLAEHVDVLASSKESSETRQGHDAQEESEKVTESKVVRLFEMAYQRKPTTIEIEQVKVAVRQSGWTIVCRAILNSNEFIYWE